MNDFSVLLLHGSEIGERSVDREARFLGELPPGGGEWLLVGLDFALRNRPRAGIATSKYRASRVGEQDGDPRLVPAVNENAGASFFRPPDHETYGLRAW